MGKLDLTPIRSYLAGNVYIYLQKGQFSTPSFFSKIGMQVKMSDIYFSSKTRKPLVHNGFESFLEKNNFCQYRDRVIIALEECGFTTARESEKANRFQRRFIRRLFAMPRGFFYKKVFSVSIGRECVIKANRIQRSSVKCLFTMG